MPNATSSADSLPAALRAVAGTSLRLLVRVDHVAERATETTERLAALLPRPRRPYDEL